MSFNVFLYYLTDLFFFDFVCFRFDGKSCLSGLINIEPRGSNMKKAEKQFRSQKGNYEKVHLIYHNQSHRFSCFVCPTLVSRVRPPFQSSNKPSEHIAHPIKMQSTLLGRGEEDEAMATLRLGVEQSFRIYWPNLILICDFLQFCSFFPTHTA